MELMLIDRKDISGNEEAELAINLFVRNYAFTDMYNTNIGTTKLYAKATVGTETLYRNTVMHGHRFSYFHPS